MFAKLQLGRSFLAGAVTLLWLAPHAQAQLRHWHRPQPYCIEELAKPPVVLDKKDQPPAPEATPEVTPELAARTTAALGDPYVSVPQIMGDFGGYCRFRTIGVPVVATITTRTPAIDSPGFIFTLDRVLINRPVVVCDPIAARAGSGFKVADNESPKPTDRVFFTYNYFGSLRGEGASKPEVIVTDQIRNTTITVVVPGVAVPDPTRSVHRQVFGFEKTFLDGNASVELRLPFYQTNRDDTYNADDFGDLTVVTRYAFINNPETGNVFSVGLAVTAPTGPAINTAVGDINSTLIQPWFGYIGRAGNFYFQGIHSLLIPTNSDDITLLFNDLSTGYIIPIDCAGIAFAAPNIEVHITTPLEDRDRSSPVYVPDIVNLTTGIHLGLGEGRTRLSFGVAVPLTGPRPMDIEGFMQLNFQF